MKYYIEFAPINNSGIITQLEKTQYFSDLDKCMQKADDLYNLGSQYVKVLREDGAIYCELEF